MIFDGLPVIVPQGKPVEQSDWLDSEIRQSEYIVHSTTQIRLRYVMLIQYGTRYVLNNLGVKAYPDCD